MNVERGAPSAQVLAMRAQLAVLPAADRVRVRQTVNAMKAVAVAAGPLSYIAIAVLGAEISSTIGDADALDRVLDGKEVV